MGYLSEVQGKGGIRARVVAASIANNTPLWTLEVRAPKFLDAELRTHRMLSQNSSSSRAVPFKPNDNPYIPADLRKKQSGMQGYACLEENEATKFRIDLLNHIKETNMFLEEWKDSIHKQHINRYAEPWTMQTKVITATEWDNFFRLRLAADAQPEIQELARCMQAAMVSVTPKFLEQNAWHLPYAEDIDDLNTAIKCSVSRCARTSYLTHERKEPVVNKDIDLAHKLLAVKHLSPSEHQATPMQYVTSAVAITALPALFNEPGVTHIDNKFRIWSGNFRNWSQYRQLVHTWN